jgi:uncharacterized protein
LICYLDSSALVKRYVTEPGSSYVIRAFAEAHLVGTATISRAEVVAGFIRAVRRGSLASADAEFARHQFQTEWRHFQHHQITDSLIGRSCDLAWSFGLRGYDSVQLAAAVRWQEELDLPLTLATFDGQLWQAAARVGLEPYPPSLLEIR